MLLLEGDLEREFRRVDLGVKDDRLRGLVLDGDFGVGRKGEDLVGL